MNTANRKRILRDSSRRTVDRDKVEHLLLSLKRSEKLQRASFRISIIGYLFNLSFQLDLLCTLTLSTTT